MSIETYITEFSKYIIALIAVLYAADCLLYFLIRKEENRRVIYLWQNMLIFAFHFSSFLVICFETKEVSYLVFYAIQQITIYAVMMLYRYVYPRSNRFLVNNMCMCLSISFVMLTRLDYTKAVKQFLIAAVSLALALVIPFFVRKLVFLKNLKWIYAAVGIALLGVVLILGQTTYGSRISYTIGGMTFQPAEFVKLLFVFYVASALYQSVDFFDVFTTAVIAAAHVLIQVMSKDLGSALIFFVIYVCMVYAATQKVWYLILGLCCGSGAAYLAFRVYSHIQNRVTAWLDPFSVIDGAGYQITQSLFGISSGGYFGLGLMQGSPTSIPFVEVDFIFSAIAEELGIIFAVALIFICLATFAAMMQVAMALSDRFYRLIAFGIGIAYIFQVFLTIGGGTKFIPLTGVTLPLVSYGGSSMLTTLMMFAIVEGVFIIREDEEQRRKQEQRTKKRKKEKRPAAEKERRARREENQKKTRPAQNERPRPEREERRGYDAEYDIDDVEEYDEPDIDSDREYEIAEAERLRMRRLRADKEQRVAEKRRPRRRYDEAYEDDEDLAEEASDIDEDDDLEFLHGYTRQIRTDAVNEALEAEELGRIYYNEEEYERDRERKQTGEAFTE